MGRVIRIMNENKDMFLARQIALKAKKRGGRALFVGGVVRDSLLGVESKDIDIEVYGLQPVELKNLLSETGVVLEKGASFGVFGLAHTHLDIAMPRREHCNGLAHRDFDVSVDPFMSTEKASMRRDFTINAMMRDILSGELIDHWGGKKDLEAGVIRHVSEKTFPEDALRAFRGAQFAARLDSQIAPETLALCRRMDVSRLANERIFDEMEKALLKAKKPSIFFRLLREMDHLKEFFPELEACIGVKQNPEYHPEGDVFEHTMLVVDCAAELREKAKWQLGFMISALFHDLGKIVATEIQEDGRITSYGHETLGLELTEKQMRRLTNHGKLIEYTKNQMWLHMRPNKLAQCRSKKKKTRRLFDMSVCPEDLILLSRADASGKLDEPYNENNETFLLERLEDYRKILKRPMVTGDDLIRAGLRPGPEFAEWIDRARQLHFSGLDKERALSQIISEAGRKNTIQNE